MSHKTHIYAAPEPAFLVNSFILEGARSVVVVDAQFLLSSAAALRSRIDAIGKPIAALILTHPHPDHYNGATTIIADAGATRILATSATDRSIRDTAEAKRAFWTPTYGADYPQSFAFPTEIVASGEAFSIDDIELALDDLGPGEASNIVVISAPKTGELFASDMIYSGCHPWLAEDRSDLWQQQIKTVKAKYADARIVHAGHGPSGDLGAFDVQSAYIDGFREIVRRNLSAAGLDDAAKAAIRAGTLAAHPGFPLEFLIDFNAASIARELADG